MVIARAESVTKLIRFDSLELGASGISKFVRPTRAKNKSPVVVGSSSTGGEAAKLTMISRIDGKRGVQLEVL